MTIDGESIAGELQPPADELPYDCKSERSEDVYWLYSMVILPGLPAGEHRVSVAFNALRAVSDGTITYGPGKLLEHTFRITAQ